MNCNNFTASSFTILAISCLLFLSGCATQRWTEPLAKEEAKGFENLVSDMQQKRDLCPKSLDAEAKIFLKSPMADLAISGYLQLASPSSMKFIATNPLGMLAYAFASDGKNFQILDTGKRLHIRGGIRPLAIRNSIPLILIQGDWFAYLNKDIPSQELTILQVSKDIDDDSYWLKFGTSAAITSDESQWLHLDAKQQRVLGYMFFDRSGEVVAEIRYNNEVDREKNGCFPVARNVLINKLPWGSEIRIELTNIRTDMPLSDNDFILPVPKEYYKQLQP